MPGPMGNVIIQAITGSNRTQAVRTVAINNGHGTEKPAEVALCSFHFKQEKRKDFVLETSSIDCI